MKHGSLVLLFAYLPHQLNDYFTGGLTLTPFMFSACPSTRASLEGIKCMHSIQKANKAIFDYSGSHHLLARGYTTNILRAILNLTNPPTVVFKSSKIKTWARHRVNI